MYINKYKPLADCGFPMGVCGHPTPLLFSENVCKNEIILAIWG